MFAFCIRYLNGWSMAAADGAKKELAEWPPHPDRVFMALAAAWFETGEDAEEGTALRWLEALPPPCIAASGRSLRTVVTSYVPVNDDKGGSKKTKTELQRLKKRGLAVVPEHRPRKPRSFPVAIPHDPTVRLIWEAKELGDHATTLERLAAKVTHIGHSASFVQMWLERESTTDPTWKPTDGMAVHKLRVPSPGRLDRLALIGNRRVWFAYKDLNDALDRAKSDLKAMAQPPRALWSEFPDTVLLAHEMQTKLHSEYTRAKAGDPTAAALLVDALLDDAKIATLRNLIADRSRIGAPTLVSVHAYESGGVNAIPIALARLLSRKLRLPNDEAIIQTNVVAHTGADGYSRLARQAAFDGPIVRGTEYVMVDDFVGQGGTLANLRGWIAKHGGNVIGAVVLTGRPYSVRLNPSKEQLHELRQKHGSHLERWWKEHFGHAFDCLTHSEARYLARSPDVDTIRDRIAAVQQAGNEPRGRRSPREQRRHIRDLRARIIERFPTPPRKPRRPHPGKWQGYGRVREAPPEATRGSVFDSRIIVLTITGKRIPLAATLKVISALRGLLMRECPEQPPPEWFSGHQPNGMPTSLPHMALAPLPFVGSRYADGAIMGLAVVLPDGLDEHEAGRCLEHILRDPETGLPRQLTLFDGRWLECGIELETSERTPRSLDPDTWTGGSAGSRVWASVTPVVMNRHFDGKNRWDRAAASLKEACEHIGLPRPRDVLLHPVSLVEGVPHAREFPQMTRKSDGGRRRHSHVVIVFDKPVRGPISVGAGRFRGYGLCRPIADHGAG